MTGAAVAPLAGGDPVRYAALAALTAILVGVLALLARVARLGFITDFLSKPILVGYIFGVTLIVIGSQLGKIFGIKLEADKFFQQVLELISRLDEAHLLTVAIGIVCMAALFIMRRVNRALPGPLIVVVGAIIASAVFDLQARGVAIVGAVPAGLPRLAIPAVSFQDILTLLPAALALKVTLGGKVAAITALRADLDDFSAGKDALEGFINYPRSIVGVEVAVSFREEAGGLFRVSFRSQGRVNVAAVATGFGGGGHHNAAGCTVPGTLAAVKRKVYEALGAALP